MQDRYRSLTQINLDDLMAAFGWQHKPVAARIGRALLIGPARSFAQQMVAFDDATGARGLPDGARQAERLLARDVEVYGRENLPRGAFLALSNHPGLTDTLALFSALNRPDLRIIALERPFLINLMHVSERLFYLPDGPSERAALVREVARALRDGTPILTFPAGHIEPDPDVFPGAIESLEAWMESAEIFVRLAPETPIVPVCVRGVTWKAAARHPLVRMRRLSSDRQLMASAMQLMWQLLFKTRPVTVKVQIGRPVLSSGSRNFDAGALHSAVLGEMRRLIGQAPSGHWESAL